MTSDAGTWWETFFASSAWQAAQLGWATEARSDDDAAGAMRALGLQPGERILDAPCGTGRIAARFAAGGCDVVGVDITERFLEEGRARRDGVRYETGDVRDLPFEGEFDAAICFGGSFGYFDDVGNLDQARSAARALREGGRFLIDTHTTESLYPRFRDRNWFETSDVTVLSETSFDLRAGRVETEWTLVRGNDRHVERSSIRVYSLHELIDMLRDAGFSRFEATDDHLADFVIGSGRLWLVATT